MQCIIRHEKIPINDIPGDTFKQYDFIIAGNVECISFSNRSNDSIYFELGKARKPFMIHPSHTIIIEGCHIVGAGCTAGVIFIRRYSTTSYDGIIEIKIVCRNKKRGISE